MKAELGIGSAPAAGQLGAGAAAQTDPSQQAAPSEGQGQ